MLDGKAFGEQMAAICKTYVDEQCAPLVATNKALEERIKTLEGEIAKKNDGGIGLADAFIDRDGELVLTMSDGRAKKLGSVVGKDGETFGLDDFNIEQGADARTFKFMFQKGEVGHSFEFEFPVVLDRGVFAEGKAYQEGDAVTWGGSLWIAQRSTEAKPDTADSGWRLAVKRGRDGKDKS